MTLVDDQLAIVGDHVIDFALAYQALDDGDVDDTGRAPLAAADLTDLLAREIEKAGEPGEPLVQELATMDPDEGIGPAGGDQGSRDYRLAECGGRRQHAGIVPQQRFRGSILLLRQLAFECRSERTTAIALVAGAHNDAQPREPRLHLVAAPARQGHMVRQQLRAADDTGDTVGGQAHPWLRNGVHSVSGSGRAGALSLAGLRQSATGESAGESVQSQP
ncbi:MAG: hypothetical protein OXH96_10130 [Spirochaetaceae bacterium]|nr:hypothetical protein [Spirochaetaceae bacterium]